MTINNPSDYDMSLCWQALNQSVEGRVHTDVLGNMSHIRPRINPQSKNQKDFYTPTDLKGLAYFGFGQEEGKSGTKHLHCLVIYERAKAFKTIKKTFPRANIQAMRGTFEEALEYGRKDGRYHYVNYVPMERVKTYVENDNKLSRLSLEGDQSIAEYRKEVQELREELREFKSLLNDLLSQKKILNTL